MYIKKNNYDNALRKVRIEVGTLVGLETDAEAYLILKEMDTLTTLKMKSITANNEDVVSFFKDVLPSIIVEHNFYEEEEKKMSNEELASFIFQKIDLTTKVIEEYTTAIFRVKPAAKDGDTLSES